MVIAFNEYKILHNKVEQYLHFYIWTFMGKKLQDTDMNTIQTWLQT